MIKSKKIRKYGAYIAIGALTIALVLVIVFGEKRFISKQKKVYEGCKSVYIEPINKVVVEYDY